jgi:predicted nucleic acid-binding protein
VEHGFDSPEAFAGLLRGMVAGIHKVNAVAPIRFPGPEGAFPGDILLRPPPVVVDANVLRNDILRACRTGQRTVLVTAANAGLLRLFCAEHVYREVIEHSGDWTVGGAVTRDAFLRRWLLEYLPLIRVVRIEEGQLSWLDPAELARIRHLAQPGQDADDVPSAVLALLLEAFFLSEDGDPLRAVYGVVPPNHREWVSILKAGGDAGELGKTVTLAVNLTALAGHGLASATRRVAAATSPWLLVAAGLGAVWWYFTRPDSTRQRVASIAESVLNCVFGAAIAYQEVQDRFTSGRGQAPSQPPPACG